MHHRVIAVIFGLVGLLLVVLWMQPKPIQHVGTLHNYRYAGLTIRDVSGRWLQTRDTIFIRTLAAAMDEAVPLGRIERRRSRGYFECTFERNGDRSITVVVLCIPSHGPVLREHGFNESFSADHIAHLLIECFPEGQWCTPPVGMARR